MTSLTDQSAQQNYRHPLQRRFFRWADKTIQMRKTYMGDEHARLTKDDIKNFYSSQSDYSSTQLDREMHGDGTYIFGNWNEFGGEHARNGTLPRQKIAEGIMAKMREYVREAKGRQTKAKDCIQADEYEALKNFIEKAHAA